MGDARREPGVVPWRLLGCLLPALLLCNGCFLYCWHGGVIRNWMGRVPFSAAGWRAYEFNRAGMAWDLQDGRLLGLTPIQVEAMLDRPDDTEVMGPGQSRRERIRRPLGTVIWYYDMPYDEPLPIDRRWDFVLAVEFENGLVVRVRKIVEGKILE